MRFCILQYIISYVVTFTICNHNQNIYFLLCCGAQSLSQRIKAIRIMIIWKIYERGEGTTFCTLERCISHSFMSQLFLFLTQSYLICKHKACLRIPFSFSLSLSIILFYFPLHHSSDSNNFPLFRLFRIQSTIFISMDVLEIVLHLTVTFEYEW